MNIAVNVPVASLLLHEHHEYIYSVNLIVNVVRNACYSYVNRDI